MTVRCWRSRNRISWVRAPRSDATDGTAEVFLLGGFAPAARTASPPGLVVARLFSQGLRPRGPAPTDLVVARLRRLRPLSRGRMPCAHCTRPPPLGRPPHRGATGPRTRVDTNVEPLTHW